MDIIFSVDKKNSVNTFTFFFLICAEMSGKAGGSHFSMVKARSVTSFGMNIIHNRTK